MRRGDEGEEGGPALYLTATPPPPCFFPYIHILLLPRFDINHQRTPLPFFSPSPPPPPPPFCFFFALLVRVSDALFLPLPLMQSFLLALSLICCYFSFLFINFCSFDLPTGAFSRKPETCLRSSITVVSFLDLLVPQLIALFWIVICVGHCWVLF